MPDTDPTSEGEVGPPTCVAVGTDSSRPPRAHTWPDLRAMARWENFVAFVFGGRLEIYEPRRQSTSLRGLLALRVYLMLPLQTGVGQLGEEIHVD